MIAFEGSHDRVELQLRRECGLRVQALDNELSLEVHAPDWVVPGLGMPGGDQDGELAPEIDPAPAPSRDAAGYLKASIAELRRPSNFPRLSVSASESS